MALSELGLTPEEVDIIMRDIAGQPQPTSAVIGETVNRSGQPGVMTPGTSPVKAGAPTPAGSSVKTTSIAPPVIGMKMQEPVKKSSSTGPVIVGATTGLIFGGPVGAAVGAGAMWLLDKAIKK